MNSHRVVKPHDSLSRSTLNYVADGTTRYTLTAFHEFPERALVPKRLNAWHLIYSSRIAKLRGCKNEKDWSSEFCGVNGTRSGGILRGLCIPDDYKS
ncbi:MAG: hypothetical protein ACXV5I_02880, partial [Halobacteriota archaeon]